MPLHGPAQDRRHRGAQGRSGPGSPPPSEVPVRASVRPGEMSVRSSSQFSLLSWWTSFLVDFFLGFSAAGRRRNQRRCAGGSRTPSTRPSMSLALRVAKAAAGAGPPPSLGLRIVACRDLPEADLTGRYDGIERACRSPRGAAEGQAHPARPGRRSPSAPRPRSPPDPPAGPGPAQ